MGYDVVVLNHTISGKLPPDLVSCKVNSFPKSTDTAQTCPIPAELPFPTPPKLQILRRCTLILSDPSQNYRLSNLAKHYDMIALRPTTEKALQLACQTLDCDLVSIDLTQRFPAYFRHKMLSPGIQRGVKFEICYGGGVLSSDAIARRNVIQNAVGLIRATRGRGIVVSSEAKRALACRAPADVMNLVTVWGMSQEKGIEAVGREARAVIVQAGLKRTSYQGVVDVIEGGERPKLKGPTTINTKAKGKARPENTEQTNGDVDSKKRKAEETTVEEKPVSKREQKRRAKKARLEVNGPPADEG